MKISQFLRLIMETSAIHHVFEESSCCLCFRHGVDQYLRISDNFIKYNNKLVSFAEAIRKTLEFEVSNLNLKLSSRGNCLFWLQANQSNSSMEICDLCKTKLVEFYHFKMRSEIVRLNFSKTDFCSQEKPLDIESFSNDKAVFTTIQIVRDFISRHTFVEIKEDEIEQQLIFISKAPRDLQDDLEVKVEEAVMEESFLEHVELLREEEMASEYLEDCLAEEEGELLSMKDIKEEDHNVDELEDFEEDILDQTEENIFEYEESDSSYDHQQTSESASDSKKPSNPRRPRNPNDWACNKRKSLRNSGQTYRNSKGKIVEAKQMRESCGKQCRSKCIQRISEEDRQEMFQYYWGLGDVVKQRKFIYEHITSAEPKRRRTETSNRTITLQFYLETKGEDEAFLLVQVCKKMFKNTLVVSSQVIQGVVKKYSLEGFNDSRGKFKRKLTTAQQIAVEHVKKFPFFYIEQTMTKVQCYQLYCHECVEQGIEPVKEGNYRDIFDRQNQGNFLKTERISCETCHRYYKATDEEREQLQREHDSHIGLGSNKKCRDRALGRLRHKRAQERKKRQAAQEAADHSEIV